MALGKYLLRDYCVVHYVHEFRFGFLYHTDVTVIPGLIVKCILNRYYIIIKFT